MACTQEISKEPGSEVAAFEAERAICCTTVFKYAAKECVGAAYTLQGRRPYQEDRAVVDEAAGFFAVYDGHCGDKASEYCREHMGRNVMEELAKSVVLGAVPDNVAVEKAMISAFIETDRGFFASYDTEDGSTACVACVMRHMDGSAWLHVANAGDSRCILVYADGSVVAMSQDHKPEDPEEFMRIQEAGYDVTIQLENCGYGMKAVTRVQGDLSVSRGIGDKRFKKEDLFKLDPERCAVTCVPKVRHIKLDSRRSSFLVIASDGIWDVISNDDAGSIVTQELKRHHDLSIKKALEHAARELVNSALTRGSCDNCTAVVVVL